MKGNSIIGKIIDQESLLHKLLTYGVALVLIVVCFIISSSSEEINPATGTIIVVFLFYYAVLSRRILETLIFGSVMGMALVYGQSGTNGFIEGLQEMVYGVMMSEDFVWMIINCDLLNVFVVLLAKAGSTGSFSKIVTKNAKSAKTLNLWTWFMQIPMFFDDCMHITVNSGIMMPIYDSKNVPREEGAFLIQTLGEPIRVLFPISSWTAFMAGIFVVDGFANTYSEGLMAFIKTIPFSFYAWVSVIGALLFALGLLPKFGNIKNPDKSVYKEIEGIEENDSKKHGNLFDFFMPIFAMIGLSYVFEWDLVPAMLIVVPLTFVYYMIRGIIGTAEVEESFIQGCEEFTQLNLLVLFSYILGTVIEEIGYTGYLVEIAQGFANPKLLPFVLFVIFCISEAAMSLNWNLLLIAFPVVLPLAVQLGANPYMCAAAMISAGAFGNNFCYICDFTSLTSTACGLPPAYQAKNCLPYALIFAGITAVLYLVCGFIF